MIKKRLGEPEHEPIRSWYAVKPHSENSLVLFSTYFKNRREVLGAEQAQVTHENSVCDPSVTHGWVH